MDQTMQKWNDLSFFLPSKRLFEDINGQRGVIACLLDFASFFDRRVLPNKYEILKSSPLYSVLFVVERRFMMKGWIGQIK